jgi:DegV family protein with EDD domain
MNEYKIFTDSGCDLKDNTLLAWEVSHESLTFRFTDSETEYKNGDMDINAFYEKMIEGKVAKTAAINTDSFVKLFEPALIDGRDILYVGFSSGLSTTYNSARLAAVELSEKYPERKIVTVDSLCASAGQGLLLRLAIDKREEGKSLEENAAYLESIKLNVCHWFTVNDLVYLKRGGRISPTAALVGNLLGIKPVLHVDNEGKLVNVSKVRGRRASIQALADKYTELALKGEIDHVFISHAYCENDAKLLSEMIEKSTE